MVWTSVLVGAARMSILDFLRNEAKQWSGAAKDPAPVENGRVNGQKIPKGRQPVTRYKVKKMTPGVFVEFDSIEEATEESEDNW